MEGTTCNLYEDCQKSREVQAEFRGTATAKLINIEKVVSEIWGAININREDVKKLYFKIGVISGSVSFVVSIVISLLMFYLSKKG